MKIKIYIKEDNNIPIKVRLLMIFLTGFIITMIDFALLQDIYIGIGAFFGAFFYHLFNLFRIKINK